MTILDDIKKLREITGAGVMDCKSALAEAGGDIEKAAEILRKKGFEKAEKKEGNETENGIVESYIHNEGRIGVLVQVGCQTDFVARNEEFKKLAKELAMQIAATNPSYISRETIPEEVLEKETSRFAEELRKGGKSEDAIKKALEGKIKKFCEENCLLDQRYFRDENVKVGDLIKSYIAKFGENIKVLRFARFEVR